MEIHGVEGGFLSTRGQPEWFFLKGLEERKDQLQRVTSPRNLAEDVISALRDGTPLTCDALDGRKSVELLTAIYASARQDGAVVCL